MPELVFWGIGVVTALVALDRLLLGMGSKNWVYYCWTKARRGGSVYHMLELHSIFDPGIQQVLELTAREERIEDESGDPLAPQPHDGLAGRAAMSITPIPDGYHAVTPYLLVDRVGELIDFLTQAFDAEPKLRLDRPDGSIMHAEVRIGDSVVMMGEPMAEFGAMPSSIYLYVGDCDAVYQRALQAGATSVMEPTDMYHAGERYGGVQDRSGNIWWVATHVEDVSAEEQARRIERLAKQQEGRWGPPPPPPATPTPTST